MIEVLNILMTAELFALLSSRLSKKSHLNSEVCFRFQAYLYLRTGCSYFLRLLALSLKIAPCRLRFDFYLDKLVWIFI